MTQVLTAEKFSEIYKNEIFLRDVAYAHQQCDKNGNFRHFETISYPARYIVTKEQIESAKAELLALKERRKIEHKGKLVFIAMGMKYESDVEDDICNHRVRAYFQNAKSHNYFIEVGTGRVASKMRCDHSIDRDLEDFCNKSFSSGQPYNNCFDLETKELGAFTLKNLLNIVNNTFGCNFKEIVIDYTLSPEEIVSISPK